MTAREQLRKAALAYCAIDREVVRNPRRFVSMADSQDRLRGVAFCCGEVSE